jgi:hypothetical protein
MRFGYATSLNGAPVLVKIYDQGNDWQILAKGFNERWFSKHNNVPADESLDFAIGRFCCQNNLGLPSTLENTET